MNRLTIALPKGRLADTAADLLAAAGFRLDWEDRQLVAETPDGRLRALLVKNSDLAEYVAHGVAALGICGDDVLGESGHPLLRLLALPFGATRMSVCGYPEPDLPSLLAAGNGLRIATKFVRFTRAWLDSVGTEAEVIRLGGSVELAPVLGLAPLTVDLVETGNTLRAHGLVEHRTLSAIRVHVIANPALYKYHHAAVESLLDSLRSAIA